MINRIKLIAPFVGFAFVLAWSQPALASQAMLFNETFNDVTEGFSGNDPRRFGIPTIASFGTDENWYGVRFEQPDNGSVANDVGVQEYGGGNNNSQTGLIEDDAGLMFRIDASMYTDIVLKFDWRTFSVDSSDRLRVGYFVGDITAGNAGFQDGAIDLRDGSQGGSDGDYNWGAGWIELGSFSPDNNFSTEMFNLTAAAGQSEVWITLWLDGGEGDFGKIDDIMVFGEQAVVPVPGAVWLFGSAFLGLVGLRRRK